MKGGRAAIQQPASRDSTPRDVSARAAIENVAITHDKRQLIVELFSRLQLLSHAEWYKGEEEEEAYCLSGAEVKRGRVLSSPEESPTLPINHWGRLCPVNTLQTLLWHRSSKPSWPIATQETHRMASFWENVDPFKSDLLALYTVLGGSMQNHGNSLSESISSLKL